MSARKGLPQHQINYPVSQSYIYQTPLVHDSPATRTQSSSENLVSQTNYVLLPTPRKILTAGEVLQDGMAEGRLQGLVTDNHGDRILRGSLSSLCLA